MAREAQVSARTVSRVLNDEPRISAPTRERVLQAVARLGYRRNAMARNMRVGARDSAVGLVIPDLANPFFSVVAAAVERTLRTRGLYVVIASSEEDPARERAVVTDMLGRQVAALVVVPSGDDHAYLRLERRRGLPVVFLDRPPNRLAADAFVSANTDGAHQAVTHLLAHGHRRIGFIGDRPTTLYTRRERFRGYRSALAQAGIAVDPALVDRGHHENDAAEATVRLLSAVDPPTAVFAANNLACMGAMMALARARRRDVALVGFDDFTLADVFDPGITVVAQDPHGLGTAAAERVFARLDGDRGRARTTVLATRLIVRGSGEISAS
ncbi:LacI family transcriptional regulator [Virgisporangium aliadipatigenens]|uniref:LacI family transcriptional regulator n=1 Tax=Virgisporangium aliadipatigenens TaxID=741659 RepID=A0A8J3YLJ1_9ACTN|nr:LacI family transcriptional regulator [Virgisporangium aliadipatigenens]